MLALVTVPVGTQPADHAVIGEEPLSLARLKAPPLGGQREDLVHDLLANDQGLAVQR